MQNKYYLLAIIFLFIFSTLSFAQLGEEAGQPFINVSVGSSATFNYLILNSGSNSIAYQIILPTLNNIPKNTTPTVLVTPMNGTLAPHSQQLISIAVQMPSSDKPYLKWQGILQVIEISAQQNSTSGMGAVIREGVAKIVTIESLPPLPLPFYVYIIIAIIVVIVIAVIIYLIRRRRKAKLEALKKSRKAATIKVRKSASKKKQIKKVAKETTRKKTKKRTVTKKTKVTQKQSQKKTRKR